MIPFLVPNLKCMDDRQLLCCPVHFRHRNGLKVFNKDEKTDEHSGGQKRFILSASKATVLHGPPFSFMNNKSLDKRNRQTGLCELPLLMLLFMKSQ